MTTFLARAKADGGLEMSDYQRATLKEKVKENAGSRMRLVIDKETPESRKQRAFYHGAILPLWAYLDSKDYRSPEILAQMHEVAKLEFNPDVFIVNGKPRKIGKTSKGALNEGYLERIIDFLVDQYGIDPAKVLEPKLYKKFRDEIWGLTTKYDTFIDYLLDIKLL